MKFLITFSLFLLFGCNSAPKSNPLITISETLEHINTIDSLSEVTIIFSGDFMQHGPQITAATTANGFDYITHLEDIKEYWQSAHYSVINLETTLSSTPPYSGYPIFRSPVESVTALQQSGITHLALANNHTMDKGLRGVRSTLSILDSIGIEHYGLGEGENRALCFITHGNIKVALLNATYGTNGMPVPRGVNIISSLDTTLLAPEIQRAQDSAATHIIAYVHWGNEYQTTPHPTQKELGLWLREKGVNVVVGSHPHVAQPIDHKNSIVYSLGNFVSNQRWEHSDAGYNIRLRIFDGSPKVIIEPTAHYVDVSEGGSKKYRVLRLCDTIKVSDAHHRQRMINAIEKVENIIQRKVRYD